MRFSRALLAFFSLFVASIAIADAPLAFDRNEAPQAPQITVLPDVAGADDIILLGFPEGRLVADQQVDITVTSPGRQLAAESLRVTEARVESGFIAIELFAEAPDTHELFSRLNDEARKAVRVEIRVDGRVYSQMSLTELLQASADTRALGILPSAVSPIEGSAEPRIPICGDGICGGGGGGPIPLILGEDCESCPEDCGGPCSICGNGFCGQYESCNSCAADCGACPTCPQVIGTETRTVLLSYSSLGWQCLQDYIFWDQSVYYDFTKFDYKRYTVQRVRQCNGSITETIVPGTTTYFSSYCYRYTYVPCYGGFYPPSCVTF